MPTRTSLALAVVLLASRAGGAAPTSGLRVELPAPRGGATARLHVRRRGEGMGAGLGATLVSLGGAERRIEAGQSVELVIAADATRLERVVVDGAPLLVFIAPGADLWLVDDPCTSWRLDGSWLDSNDAQPPDAYCAGESQPCRAGFDDGSRPRLARDPVCAHAPPDQDVKRCVRLGAVRARPPAKIELGVHEDETVPLDGSYRPVRWSGRSQRIARAGADRVGLVIGPAERWTLFVGDDGRIGGTRDARR